MQANSFIFVWFVTQLCSINGLIGFQQNANDRGLFIMHLNEFKPWLIVVIAVGIK